MKVLFRARLLLSCAAVFALVVFAVEFPFSEIFHQRSQLSALQGQLSAIVGRNNSLVNDIASLKKSSTVEAIAHQDYGLIEPGQASYVILPAPSASHNASSLANSQIPASDLVAAPLQSASSAPSIPAQKTPGVLSRFVQRLEFWH